MKRLVATVKRVRRESDDIVTIYFTVPNFKYKAGQYITVFFPDSSCPQGKAYSLSSAPHEKWQSITVKKIGEYSGRLHALKAGDKFFVSSAYGFFNPETNKPLVCIGAGCGISPIWSVLKDELRKDEKRHAQVFYGNKTADGISFIDELNEYENAHDNFKTHHYITRQEIKDDNMKKGRISLDDCLKAFEESAHYLICGSVDFVRDMWRGLVSRGISEESISTETFFE